MKRITIMFAVLALVAAACGGDSDDAQAKADACAVDETDGDLNLYNWTQYIPTGSLAEEFAPQYSSTNVRRSRSYSSRRRRMRNLGSVPRTAAMRGTLTIGICGSPDFHIEMMFGRL